MLECPTDQNFVSNSGAALKWQLRLRNPGDKYKLYLIHNIFVSFPFQFLLYPFLPRPRSTLEI